MRCPQCGSRIELRRSTHHYVESGLPYIVLDGVRKGTCAGCGETALLIPKIIELHQAIARDIAMKPARLVPAEVKFLRKFLGLASKDLAEYMSVEPETVSRWESPKQRHPMVPMAEKLLRVMIFCQGPKHDYKIGCLPDLALGKPKALQAIKAKVVGEKWKTSLAAV